MKHLKRIGLTAALLMALVIGFGVAPASAGLLPGMPKCNHTDLVGSYTLNGGGFAELDLYWDATNHTNCVKLQHKGAAYDHAAPTSVYIFTCVTDTAGQDCVTLPSNPPYYGSDTGNYPIYAGYASVKAAGHCIYAVGYLTWAGKPYKVESAPGAKSSHC